jgi:hypothetical protein
LHEFNAGNQVVEPAGKRLQTGVTILGPVVGNLTVLETQVHRVELFTHHNETVNSILKVTQGVAHNTEQAVELLHFLDKHCGE